MIERPAAIWFGVAAGILLSGFSRSAQDQRPTFRTEANYVRVDVFPTVDGTPVGDLRPDEFEIFEDRVLQRIEQFEHVAVRGSITQQNRHDPNTVAESREAAGDPRVRVFVLFLDRYHVEVEGSHDIRKPLIDMLNQVIGEDDLVAVMTPEMSAADITFARKTTTIEGMLTRYWPWGERGRSMSSDRQDDEYRACYPAIGPTAQCPDDARGVADELIARRREKLTIDALQDLVRHLRDLREERKAIVAISDGWLLYREDPALLRRLYCQPPGAPEVAIDPRTGKFTSKPTRDMTAAVSSCDVDRMRLAQIDDDRQFRDILDEANRANASFYPVDPRGLPVFDSPISKPLPPALDQKALQARLTSLRTLAEATDGIAIVNSNDLAGGLRRVAADLSSYYLLGYYSTGKLDGKFHSISVRVKRPRVQVRARRGFLAPAVADVTMSRASGVGNRSGTGATDRAPAALAVATAVRAAVSELAGTVRDQPFHVLATAGWRPGDGGHPVAVFWTVAEVADRIPGSDLDVVVTTAAGEPVATSRARITPGTTSALVPLMPASTVVPGDYLVRVHSQTPASSDTVTVHVPLPAPPNPSGALYIRRGPVTGNKEVPTADPRFRRSEQLRVDVPIAEPGAVTARLLDRAGAPIPVPVTAGERSDPDGTRWATARVALVPLASGDYVFEMVSGASSVKEMRTIVAFRILP